MSVLIGRTQARRLAVALTTSAATTPEIGFEEYSGGMVFIPAGSSITTLTFHAAPFQKSQDASGTQTFLPLFTTANVAVTVTVTAGRSYPLPAEVSGAGALKIVTDAAGNVELSLKG